MTSSTWAHAAFALGYAEDGTFPVSLRTQQACLAVQSIEADDPRIVSFITEAGRAEGQRAKREKAHDLLYTFHTAELAKILAKILKRLDTDALTAAILSSAHDATAAGQSDISRRHVVKGVALSALKLDADDRASLNALNASGWAHATAWGYGEAQSTSANGGPPSMAKVATAAAAALKTIPDEDAATASAGWVDDQLATWAMGAALAAGDGSALGDATRKVTDSLLDTGRATRAYTDALHQSVNQAFVASIQAQQPQAMFDFVNGGPNPCDDCIQDALNSPYAADDLPDCPLHANCFCNIEQSTSVLAGATT